MSVYEQAAQMINGLSRDNVIYLIDFMKRFMVPAEKEKKEMKGDSAFGTNDDAVFMRELEAMRIETKKYFPDDIDADQIWGEAVDEKYGNIT